MAGERIEQSEHPDRVERAERPAAKARHAPGPATPAVAAVDPASSVAGLALEYLQRAAGNAAVVQLIAAQGRGPTGATAVPTQPMAPLQRIIDPPGIGELPEGYMQMSDADKAKAIRGMLGSKSATAISAAWGFLANAKEVALANPDLFVSSVKVNDNILDLPAFADMRNRFKAEVEGKARDYLTGNKQAVQAEREKTGIPPPTTGGTVGEQVQARVDILSGKGASEETNAEVQKIQKAADEMERVKAGKAKCLATAVGYREVPKKTVTGEWEDEKKPVLFGPGQPPPEHEPPAPTYEEVLKEWNSLLAAESALVRTYPSAAFFVGEGGDPSKIKGDKDIRVARAEIATALADVEGRIDAAIPKIGNGVNFTDLVPIQQELLAGPEWSKPVQNAVAKEEISDADLGKLLAALGVGTLSAAAFLFASFASGGLATFLFAAGAGISGAQAGVSWDNYFDLAAAQKASIDPAAQLVTGEQVDAAMISALLDTVFAAMDLWQGAKGVKAAAAASALAEKSSKGMIEAAEAGAKANAASVLRNLGSAQKPGEALAMAVAEVGPEEAQRLSGLSFEQLAQKAGGKGTPLGDRFLLLAEKGAGAMSEETKGLLAKLPSLASITDAAEGEKVLAAGISELGYLGVLKKVGGWGAIKKTAVMKSGTGSAAVLEGWRAGLVRELDKYIQEASDKLSKTVRTGTEQAASDLDVQILGDAAAQLKKEAESWLAQRMGTNVDDASRLLDATIFIDPTRAHLVDLMRDLPENVRAQIRSETASIEPPLIMGARLKAAEKYGKAAQDKVLEEARLANVTPDLTFVPLTPQEQAARAADIDKWMADLRDSTKADIHPTRVRQVSRAQALIDASHSDSYVGGGVAVWVTGRGDLLDPLSDVNKIANALNVDPADLAKFTTAQRVSAALSEGKWIDAAVNSLNTPGAGSVEQLTRDVSNIGKHGARAAQVLRVPGTTDVGRLTQLMETLESYAKASVTDLAEIVTSGDLAMLRGEIARILDSLGSATGAAVTALRKDLTDLGVVIPQQAMADIESWLKWQRRFDVLRSAASNATAAEIRVLETAIQACEQQSVQPPSEPPAIYPQPPNQSVMPPPSAP